ncbi:MAG: oligopeptide/dipeptide ABC transporter ATP-binding protein, partial [Acidimicrobiales bacterium]
MAMILITHDLGVARGRADDIMVMYGGKVMEHAPTEVLFGETRHPYTEALLDSIPRLDGAKHTRLAPIPGAPPDIVDVPGGCRFAARCKYAQDQCTNETPILSHGGGHAYACHFPVGTDSGYRSLAANEARGHTATGLTIRSRDVV